MCVTFLDKVYTVVRVISRMKSVRSHQDKGLVEFSAAIFISSAYITSNDYSTLH